MNYILFDDNIIRTSLLPLTFLRPVADIRIGILTIREKWENMLKAKTSSLTESYLARKFPLVTENDNVLINGSICPTEEIVKAILTLKPDQTIVHGDTIIALHVKAEELNRLSETTTEGIEEITITGPVLKIGHTWDLFSKNESAIQDDFTLLTRNRKSEKLSTSNQLIGNGGIFVEKGATVECAVLNTTKGPIYIGTNAEIMEGTLIRGPVSIGDHAIVKMAGKIYGPTTIGPYCKIGGEVNNSIFFGYSNKAHDGFVGQSVIAEWCNIGADTNTSNLKNTYDSVRLWSYGKQTFVNTHLQFCGLIMGDHSKCGINTMFNTGTVVGVNANIFGPGFQRNFIPSFTWGGTAGHSNYDVRKAIEVAEEVYKRRGKVFDDIERELLVSVHHQTLKNKFI